MGLVTDKTKRVEAPDGSGWVDIKALGWLALDNARTKRIHQLSERLQALKDLKLPTAAELKDLTSLAAAQKPDPLTAYDKRYLLTHGIAAWSYGEFLPDLIEALDEPTADWAAREILSYSVPGESEMGKHSSSSTDTSAVTVPLRMNGS
jgi:hypothetical protein